MEITTIFTENLKSLRKSCGIDQRGLANYLNVSIKTISHWETGYSEPSIVQLVKLADFFDVTIDELVGRK